MKTVLDFSRVPLEKWVDLYYACDSTRHINEYGPFSKVREAATVQVKEQSDYDKEIAEACADYFDNTHDSDKYRRLFCLLEDRKTASGKAVKEVNEDTEVRSTVDLSDIPF